MKNNILKSIFGLTLSSMLFVGCVNDDDYSVPQIECNESTEVANLTIAALKASATGTATQYQAEDVIEGVVVSTDMGGNFYKVIYVNSIRKDEATGEEIYGENSFSIAVNQTNNWQQYNVGRKIYVKLKGLYVQVRNNTLQIGALYNGNVGQIAAGDFTKYVSRSCKVVPEADLLQEMSLTDAVKDENLGKLIKLKDVQFAESSLGQNYYNPASLVGSETNHTIEDLTGKTLIFRTGSFAQYAYKPVSANSGEIIGVLTKFNQDFQFVSRLETDIILATEGRLDGGTTDPGNGGEDPGNGGEDPGNGGEDPGNGGENPGSGTIAFPGGDFETWADFTGNLTTHGLKPYAVQGVGTGYNGGNSMHINGTPGGNDYVFTSLAGANVPAGATRITFYVKGTSVGKSLSFNVYRVGGVNYDVFNLGDLGTSAVTLQKAELNSNNNGTNAYIGNIATNGQWVKVTLDISTVELSNVAGQNIFALKVGKDVAYDVHIDQISFE